MKYSVIIPVYNAETSLCRCLDSLLRQPHEGVEVLLINDGSTDGSGELCRQYARMHSCVRYFEKENGGVSSARNLGLEKAAGEFILFVDSDDYVAEDYFAAIDGAVSRSDPDMLVFGLRCFGSRDDVWQTGDFDGEDPLEISRFVLRATRAYLYSNLMTRTFRREIIQKQHLRFDEALLVGEDHAFVFAYTMFVKRMVSVETVLYHYSIELGDSLSRKPRPYLTEQLLRMSGLMWEALENAGCPEKVRRVYRETVSWTHYRGAYSACKELRKFGLSGSERRSRIRQICTCYTDADIAPVGLRTWLIALPVIGKWSRLIDRMSRYSEYCRNMFR